MNSPNKNIGRMLSNQVVIDLLDRMDEKNSADTSYVQKTSSHCIATAELVAQIAPKLLGVEGSVLDAIILGAIVHDAGKSDIDITSLHRSGILKPEEISFLLDHPVAGSIIISDTLKKCEYDQGNTTFMRWQWDIAIAITALHHSYKLKSHQNYPSKIDIQERLIDENVISQKVLNSVDINKYAQLVSLCDVYNAVTSNRPYAHSNNSTGDTVSLQDTCKANESRAEIIIKKELDLSMLGTSALDCLFRHA